MIHLTPSVPVDAIIIGLLLFLAAALLAWPWMIIKWRNDDRQKEQAWQDKLQNEQAPYALTPEYLNRPNSEAESL